MATATALAKESSPLSSSNNNNDLIVPEGQTISVCASLNNISVIRNNQVISVSGFGGGVYVSPEQVAIKYPELQGAYFENAGAMEMNSRVANLPEPHRSNLIKAQK